MATIANDLPEFPFFEVTGPEAAFGADGKKYLSKQEGARISRLLPSEADAFSALFFRGGKLTDHGYRFKPEIGDKGYPTLRALMCSWEPSHETKQGTVTLAIHHWCDRIAA